MKSKILTILFLAVCLSGQGQTNITGLLSVQQSNQVAFVVLDESKSYMIVCKPDKFLSLVNETNLEAYGQKNKAYQIQLSSTPREEMVKKSEVDAQIRLAQTQYFELGVRCSKMVSDQRKSQEELPAHVQDCYSMLNSLLRQSAAVPPSPVVRK